MPPPGQSGFSGYSGYSGKSASLSGASGYSGYSGAQGPEGPAGPTGPAGGGGSTTPTPSDLTLSGSLTTGSGSGATGDIAFLGSISGAVHLRANADAGTGILLLPNTTGVHTVATLADINALRIELGLPPIGG